jgi:hypothetical protein
MVLPPVQASEPAGEKVNFTVPVGVPVPGDFGVTFAVNVADWPALIGLADGVTVVLVVAA